MIVKQPESWNETKEELTEVLETTFEKFPITPSVFLRRINHNDGYLEAEVKFSPNPDSINPFCTVYNHKFGGNTVMVSSDCATEFWDDVENTAKNMVEDFLRRFKQELSYAHDDVCDGYSQLQEIDSTIGQKRCPDE